MEYYKSYEIANKPFITWCGVGSFVNNAAFEASPFSGDPLVVPESSIVAVHGVYSMHIVSGRLITWTEEELTEWHNELDVEKALRSQSQRINSINNDKFTHDGKEFPMDETSRLFYHCIDKLRGNSKIMTIENELYELFDTTTKIDDFLTSYYSRLKLLSKHNI